MVLTRSSPKDFGNGFKVTVSYLLDEYADEVTTSTPLTIRAITSHFQKVVHVTRHVQLINKAAGIGSAIRADQPHVNRKQESNKPSNAPELTSVRPVCFACGQLDTKVGDHVCPTNPSTNNPYDNKNGLRSKTGQDA